MRKKKQSLGKGLDILFADGLAEIGGAISTYISLAEIVPNPQQPRKHFDEVKLAELATSVRHKGVLQPIIVKKLDDGKYGIVVGERRWRAAKLAELKEIPALIVDANDQEQLALSLVENLQREDLNPIEEALAYRRFMVHYGLTQEEVAFCVGKDRSTIANILRLLGLPENVQVCVSEGTLSVGHARALLALEGDKQRHLFNVILSRRLSVRETEQLVRKIARRNKDIRHADNAFDVSFSHLQSSLAAHLGTKVSVETGKQGKGKIVIRFDSFDELVCIVNRITR
jgi:ParB family chromosome partitioning protein